MIEIREVNTYRDLKKFVNFQYKLYRGNKYWVPPLRMDEINTLREDKNPAFDFCEAKYWLAVKDGEIVGRIAGIINNMYIENGAPEMPGLDGLISLMTRKCQKLFETVEAWAMDKGMTGIHGPLGFCDLDREGLLVDGFDEMGTFTTIYNYPYYPLHFEKHGYVKDVDWLEYELTIPNQIPDVIEASQNALKRFHLKVLDAKAKGFTAVCQRNFQLLNNAYSDLYGVVPLTDKQIELYTRQYFGFVNPDYVKIVLDQNDNVVAFGIAFPSLTLALRKTNGRLFPFGFIYLLDALKRNNMIDLCLVAVKPELQEKVSMPF